MLLLVFRNISHFKTVSKVEHSDIQLFQFITQFDNAVRQIGLVMYHT